MIMREGVMTQNIKPIRIHGCHLIHGIVELTLGIDACIQIVECVFITHQRHTAWIQIMLVNQILRELDALIGIHQVNLGIRVVRTATSCHRSGIRKDRFTLSTALGGNDNHTVRRTSAIQCCSGSILQHVNTKNVLRIDARYRITYTVHIIRVVQHIWTQSHRVSQDDTIQHPQGFTVTNQRRSTTNTQTRGCIDFTTIRCEHHIGNLTFQHLVKARHTWQMHILHLDGGHGTGRITLVNLLITSHHHILQRMGIFYQHHIQLSFLAYHHDFLLHTQHQERHRLRFGRHILQHIFTIHICCCTKLQKIRREHSDTRQRLTLLIGHTTMQHPFAVTISRTH